MAHKHKLSRAFGLLNVRNVKRTIGYIKKNGIHGLSDKMKSTAQGTLLYHSWFVEHRVTEEQLKEQRKHVFERNPKISIVVPLFRTPPQLLQELLDSVMAQSYENWELCLADGSMVETQENFLEAQKKREELLDSYQKRDARIHYKKLDENGGISKNTNAAMEMATGEFIGLLDHDDLLEPDALYEVVRCLQDMQVEVVYTDEDKYDSDSKTYMEPSRKPDFNSELLRCYNYITHFFVVKRTLVQKVGMLDSRFDGAQDYDFILRCTEQATDIAHVAKIVYHWRVCGGSTADDPASKQYCYEAGKLALEEHLARCKISGEVQQASLPGLYKIMYPKVVHAKVSVCVTGTKETLAEDARKRYEDAFEALLTDVTYEFLWETTKEATGDYLVLAQYPFLPADMQSLKEQLCMLARKEVAAVGGRISGNTDAASYMNFNQQETLGDVNVLRMDAVSMECIMLNPNALLVKRELLEKCDWKLDRFFKKMKENKMLLIYDAHALWQMQD